MSRSSPESAAARMRGLSLLMVTVLLWSTGPLFVKFFASRYNVWTQNAFRYTCAALILLAVMSARGRLNYRLSPGQRRKLLLVTAANLLMQTNFALTYYFIYPAVASLVGRVNIIFITVLSFLIFHDERRVIRSPFFLAGAALAPTGVVPVILGRDPELLRRLSISERDFWIGVALAVSCAFFGSVYSLTIKHAVRDVPPLVSFTHVSWMTAIGLCALMLIMGGVEDLWRQPPSGLALMALSALFCIAIAHTAFYSALRHIKAVISASVTQLIPVLTCLFSAIVYDDRLSPMQLAGGVAVIAGAWLASLAQAKEVKDEADGDVRGKDEG